MRAINSFTLCYLLLRLSLIPAAAAAALLPSTVLGIQSNQSLDLETPSLTSVLSVPPFPPRPPFPPAPTETRRIKCFDQTEPYAVAPTIKDCDSAIEVILHASPDPMLPQNFSRADSSGAHKVPKFWEIGNCQIMISSKSVHDSWDEFRYVDIVLAAQDLMEHCVPVSKLALAGAEIMGTKGFYVAVNGIVRRLTGNVTEDGNGTNATPMGMGTAVEIALPTGVRALVQGDELDEDGTLSAM